MDLETEKEMKILLAARKVLDQSKFMLFRCDKGKLKSNFKVKTFLPKGQKNPISRKIQIFCNMIHPTSKYSPNILFCYLFSNVSARMW